MLATEIFPLRQMEVNAAPSDRSCRTEPDGCAVFLADFTARRSLSITVALVVARVVSRGTMRAFSRVDTPAFCPRHFRLRWIRKVCTAVANNATASRTGYCQQDDLTGAAAVYSANLRNDFAEAD